jgi:NADH:ubiquinone oxidoreductase subunit H
MWEWSPIRDWLSGVVTPYWTFPLLTLVQAAMVTIGLILTMAFYTLAERKVIGWIQARRGPNRIGGLLIPGLAQPFADVVKLLFKEIVIPSDANGFLFRLAPFLARAHLRQYRCRTPVCPGTHLHGRIRDHPRRLGRELQVRVLGRHALGGADRGL